MFFLYVTYLHNQKLPVITFLSPNLHTEHKKECERNWARDDEDVNCGCFLFL